MTIKILEEPDESLPAYQPDSCLGRLEADDLKEAAQSNRIGNIAHPVCARIWR